MKSGKKKKKKDEQGKKTEKQQQQQNTIETEIVYLRVFKALVIHILTELRGKNR